MTPVERLAAEVRTWGPEGPVRGTVMLHGGAVALGVRAHARSRHLNLSHLWVSPTERGRGLARATLRRLLRAASAAGVSVKLRPCAFDRANGAPTTPQLTAWYVREGFADQGTTPRTLIWWNTPAPK